jgi:hypothetical protein
LVRLGRLLLRPGLPQTEPSRGAAVKDGRRPPRLRGAVASLTGASTAAGWGWTGSGSLQGGVFEVGGAGGRDAGAGGAQARKRDLAAAVLGAYDPGRTGLRGPHRLHPLEPREAWVGGAGGDWPHSTFRRCVRAGVYPADWVGTGGGGVDGGERA